MTIFRTSRSCVRTALLALVVAWGAGCAHHSTEPVVHLTGRVVANVYVSSRGHFSVPFPVSTGSEINGRVAEDDAESVVFRDKLGSRIAFYSGAIYPKSQMMALLEQQGKEAALTAYLTHRYGELPALHFRPELDGSESGILVRLAVPRTGIAAFIRGNRIFLVETDLIPGAPVLYGSDTGSQEELDGWLENRAIQLAQSMQIN